MTVTEIIKDIMIKSRPPKTMEVLANDMGYKSASGVGERLKGNNMSVKNYANLQKHWITKSFLGRKPRRNWMNTPIKSKLTSNG